MDTRTLVAAPGHILTLEGNVITAIDTSSQTIESIEFRPEEGPTALDRFFRAGLLEQRPPDRAEGRAGVTLVFNAGDFIGSTDARVLVGLTSAIYVPAGIGADERRLLYWRFIGSMDKPIRAAIMAIIEGRACLLAASPARSLVLALGRPPKRSAVEMVQSPDWTWNPVDLEVEVGPLRPASEVFCSRRGTIHVASARSLPAPGSSGEAMTGTGASTVETDSREAAIAEAYERHCAGIVPANAIVSMAAMGSESCISPERFFAYRDWQLARDPSLVHYSEQEPRLWLRSATIDGPSAFVLAELVFYPFGRAQRSRHTHANSSGMAAHRTFEEADVRAWAELVERDAFMRHWLERAPGRRIRGYPRDQLAPFADDVADAGWELHLLQLGGSPALPVICAAAVKDGALVIGAAAGPSAVAARKAVIEAWVGVCLPQEAEEVPDLVSVRDPSDHRRLFRWGDHAPEAAFLWETDEQVRFADIGALPAIPGDAVVFRWPEEVSKPYRVVRVLHHDAIPITFGYGSEPLGRQDAADLVRASGRSIDEPIFPHPFP